MSIHIHYLNYVVVPLLCFSSLGAQFIYILINMKVGNDIEGASKFVIKANLLLIALVLIVNWDCLQVVTIHNFNITLFLSLPLALLIIVAEILPFYCQAFFNKRQVEVTLKSEWRENNQTILYLVIILAVFEELIFRKILFYFFEVYFKLDSIVIIAITALLFGINHILNGRSVLIQKIIAGVFFGIIYQVSGENIVLTILIHVLQNIIILLYPTWSNGNSKPKIEKIDS